MVAVVVAAAEAAVVVVVAAVAAVVWCAKQWRPRRMRRQGVAGMILHWCRRHRCLHKEHEQLILRSGIWTRVCLQVKNETWLIIGGVFLFILCCCMCYIGNHLTWKQDFEDAADKVQFAFVCPGCGGFTAAC